MKYADLSGRVAVVTGGTRGIGAAIVRSLDAAGATVLFTYISHADIAKEMMAEMPRTFGMRVDLSDPSEVVTIMDMAVWRFKRVDILVNNAGLYEDNPFTGTDMEAWRYRWRHTFEVNLFAAADLAWLAIGWMRRHGGGRIINVTSRAAHRGELTYPDYGASKAALGNLTKSIARSCAKDGIVAFSVAPGFIDTDMAAAALAEDRAGIEAEVPSGRIGTPDEVASIVTFLASGAADYATGTTIDVNGGSYVR